MSNPRLDPITEGASVFRHLVNSVHDCAIFALHPNGQIATWNPGAERINGYTTEEVVGRHLSLFYGEEDGAYERVDALLASAIEQGMVETEGWRVQKDGSRHWANVTITALPSASGEVMGFAVVARDLTDRYASEDARRVREQQLADTQRLAGLGSWEWDVERDTVTWTDELYEIYGLDPDSFGATLAAYLGNVHPEDRERVRDAIDQAYRAGGHFEFEERIIRPDGAVRVLRSRGQAVQDEAGRTIRLMGACLDITGLRAAEQKALALAREQAARTAAEATASGLRFLVESSEILASSLDYETTLRNVAELAVPEVADWCAVDLVGAGGVLRRVAVAHSDPTKVELALRLGEKFPPQRHAPTGAWHVIDTGEAEFYPDIPDELLAQAIPDEEVLKIARELGLRSAITVPLPGRSGALGTLTLVQAESGRGLTETDLRIAQELGRHAGLAIENAGLHREMERQKNELEAQKFELEQQTEELQSQAYHLESLMEELESINKELQERTSDAEAANRAKADFLAAMSHELRTPLNAIFGYADLRDLELHGPITESQHHALDRIKRNQRALLALINDVLNFAKLEAGKLDLNIVNMTVGELIADLDAVISPQIQARRLQYECEPCAPDLGVRGDSERTEQILLNLLTNAMKFTRPGGVVTLSAEADAGVVRLRVRDNGCGIPPDRLEAIFDPFVQIDRMSAEAGNRGVGLGLAISRDLARAMGGTLSAESVVGEGSVFTLSLPRAE
jgi:PAS domain S-box-containing protein